MLNRRLIVLFVLFSLGFLVLGLRLATLQLLGAADAQENLRRYTHAIDTVETARGMILDRNGRVVAKDVPCDDLAIDYRAMNYDDTWLRREALSRIASEKFPDRAAKLKRLAEVKQQIAARIDVIPDVIAQVCKIPKEDVLERFQDIRERIHLLQEDVWVRQMDRKDPTLNETATSDDPFAPDPLDETFKKTDLIDEHKSHTIVHNLPVQIANFFRQHEEDYPGLIVVDHSNARVYPFGDVACQTIGTLRWQRADTIKKGEWFRNPTFEWLESQKEDPHDPGAGNLGGYSPGDEVGEMGVERKMESVLHGRRGCVVLDKTKDGAVEKRIEAVPGKDVKLTLDIALQRDIQKAMLDPSKHLLRGQDGKNHFVGMVVLSMDGQVLSLISWPTFDPNTIDQTRAALVQDNWRRPLVDRALEPYQPGSTVKPLLATGGLTEGVITPQTTVVCNGYLFPGRPNAFRCSIYVETNGRASHGPLQLADALAQSCNIYFYTLGGKLGIERISKWFGLYGLGQNSGFELPDANGSIPHVGTERDASEERTDSLFLGIGQGPVTATPLQMANAYATLLRGGLAITPRILLDEAPRGAQRFTLDPNVVSAVRAGMEAVVTRGTAQDIFSGMQLPVAGKTGTADTVRPAFDDNGNPVFDPSRPLVDKNGKPRLGADGKPLYARARQKGTDAWFVGYAPADRPKFVVAAVMEFGGYGGKAAAPMVREAFLQLEKHHYLEDVDGQ